MTISKCFKCYWLQLKRFLFYTERKGWASYLDTVVVHIFRQQILDGFGRGRSNFTGLNYGTIPSSYGGGQRGQAETNVQKISIICTTFRTLLKIGTRFARFFSNKIGHIPEVEWKVPGSDDECHSIGLRVEVGPVQQGDQAPTHCHLLGPGTDVPIGRREYTARLSTNKRGPYSKLPPPVSSIRMCLLVGGNTLSWYQLIGEDLTVRMHRYLLAPTTDVPIGRREYAVRLSTNKRGSYSTPPPSDSSYGCTYWTAGIRPLHSQPIGEDLTYFSIGELPISYGCAVPIGRREYVLCSPPIGEDLKYSYWRVTNQLRMCLLDRGKTSSPIWVDLTYKLDIGNTSSALPTNRRGPYIFLY